MREGDSHLPRRWPAKFTFADVLTAAAQGQPAERQLPRERETSHGVGAAESRVGPHPQVAKLDLSRFSARHGSPVGKRVAGCDPCPRGINPEDIFPKVSRASAADWIWVRKGTALSPHLGFPATRAEVRRFGGSARRIWRVPERRRDHRSFAEVVMERRPPPQRADWPANKRRATEQGSGAWGNRATRDEEELRRHLFAQKGNRGGRDGWKPNQARPPQAGDRGGTSRDHGGDRGVAGEKFPKQIRCFKCGKEGHHQANCTNPPICYKCHSTGHIAAHCPLNPMLSDKKGVKLCGFGIPGQGFYSLHVGVNEEEKAPVRGILTVLQGEATVLRVITELKHLFMNLEWDWKVKQLNEKEFLINFPSDEVRSKISTCKSFDFDCFPIKASVVETGMTEEAVDELVAVWVKIYGIPNLARNEDDIKSMVELIGEFEVLDSDSVKKEGPVRVRIACKDPRELHFSIHIYINKVGYMIRWEPEGYLPYESGHLHPGDDGDDDKDGKDDSGNEDMNLDEGFEDQSTMRGRPQQRDNNQSGARGAPRSAPPDYKMKGTKCCVDRPSKKTCKKGKELVSENSSGESKAMVVWQPEVCEEIEQESQELILPLSGQLMHKETAEMDLSLNPNKEFSTNEEGYETCGIPTNSDIARQLEEEAEEETDSFKEVSYKKKSKKKEPAVSSRMSLRHRELATVPVSKRAELLTQKKNLESTGNSHSSNPFAVFQIIPYEELNDIAVAANISLGSSEVDIRTNIETIKAKELVQAKLAEASWQAELRKKEKEKDKEVTTLELDKEKDKEADSCTDGALCPVLSKVDNPKSKRKK